MQARQPVLLTQINYCVFKKSTFSIWLYNLMFKENLLEFIFLFAYNFFFIVTDHEDRQESEHEATQHTTSHFLNKNNLST